MEVGGWVGGWVGPGLTRIFFLENRPKIALNQYSVLVFWSSIPYILSTVHTLL